MKSDSKKITYLISEYPSASHTFILREILGLRKMGWSIDTLSINKDKRPIETLTPEEQQERQRTTVLKDSGIWKALALHLRAICSFPLLYLSVLFAAMQMPGNGIKGGLWKLFYFTEALWIGFWMKDQGQHHLHVHFATSAAKVGVLVRKLFPVTFSLTVHGPDEFSDVNGQWIKEKVEVADFVVCISHFARSQLMYHSDFAQWNKLKVCPLGVGQDWFDLGAKKLARPPQPDESVFNVLCVGRLTPAKGQHLLVDAVANLHERGLNVQLTLVGDGPGRRALESHIQTRQVGHAVNLLGVKNQLEVRALMQAADVFVLPSFAEGVPVALMEAMAAAVPVVSSRIAGIGELIEHRATGCLIHAGDDQGLLLELEHLVRHPADRASMVQKARDWVGLQYNLDVNIPELSRVFARQLSFKESPCRASEEAFIVG